VPALAAAAACRVKDVTTSTTPSSTELWGVGFWVLCRICWFAARQRTTLRSLAVTSSHVLPLLALPLLALPLLL
jgi:hypothetical protein